MRDRVPIVGLGAVSSRRADARSCVEGVGCGSVCKGWVRHAGSVALAVVQKQYVGVLFCANMIIVPLRDQTTADHWIEHCPVDVHLIGGSILHPDRDTYVAWNNGDGDISSLRWKQGSEWVIVPGSAIAWMAFADE